MSEQIEMLTIRECSERTKLPYHFIRTLCLQNKIRYIRSGTKYYIRFQSLCEYLNGEGKGV